MIYGLVVRFKRLKGLEERTKRAPRHLVQHVQNHEYSLLCVMGDEMKFVHNALNVGPKSTSEEQSRWSLSATAARDGGRTC